MTQCSMRLLISTPSRWSFSRWLGKQNTNAVGAAQIYEDQETIAILGLKQFFKIALHRCDTKLKLRRIRLILNRSLIFSPCIRVQSFFTFAVYMTTTG
jgi:hypothetical protein